VGSGAGFPGIVIKIFFPNWKIRLIDSLQKRVNYLNNIINKLNLENIEAEHYRMEDYSKLHEEEFDIITARAVANLGIISEISVRSLKINGRMIFMKANCDEEIENFKLNCKKLGLEIENINKFKLPIENSNRTLISIKKINKTNKIYPRTYEKIKKEYSIN
jgi:16S rRNA (guanine527-N7)-methyltransferase